MLNQFYDDNAAIRVSKMPSNLVEVPRINEKYEISSHLTSRDNLKTVALAKNFSRDPILNLNPSFYQRTQASGANDMADPYSEAFRRTQEYQQSQKNGFVKDFIYRTDFDHPLSYHNQTLNQPACPVNFPALVEEKTLKNTTLVMNGFYSKEPLTLNINAFTEPETKHGYVTTMDERMMPFSNKENYQTSTNVFQ